MTEIEIDGVKMIIADFVCCKVWPILLGVPFGRCGDCGVRPVRVG